MNTQIAAVINQTALMLSFRLSAIVEKARAPNIAIKNQTIFFKYFLIMMYPNLVFKLIYCHISLIYLFPIYSFNYMQLIKIKKTNLIVST